jgi:methylmalonyl-CoA/ethylmalonyl-CoA epimerase
VPTNPLLDHVAVAVEALGEVGALLERDLGAVPVGGGGDAPGFRSRQWRFGNGMRLELLEPARIDENDFLRRFLDQHGAGVHHLTFRVPDIPAAVGAVEAAGFPVLYSRVSNPDWQEAFLHPRDAFGTVVQLASYPDRPGSSADPAGGAMASLDLVEVEVASTQRGLDLYAGVLCGHVAPTRPGATTLTWAGTGGLALVPQVEPADGRPAGGVRRLVLSGPLPEDLGPLEAALGTRLVRRPTPVLSPAAPARRSGSASAPEL